MIAPKIINKTANSNQNLSQKIIRGSFWVFSLRIADKLFSLVRLLILARILAPDDFGLMGIAFLAMSTLETFSQTGFQSALIQKKDDIKSYLNTAWTVSIFRGIVLFAALYLIAPFAASFFNAPQANPIIKVIGFSILFQAFTNIGVIYFQKELEFNKEFVYQFAGTLADFIAAISAVLILKNVWALVFGLIAGNAARCFASYLIHSYRPRFNFDIAKIKELFGFGKWVFGSSILIFLITQGDDIFVGKLLGVTALGFYQMAYKISNMPATEISHVISKITFPVYSKLQNDIPKLREAYLKVLRITAFLSFPIAGMIFVLAPDFTKMLLGEKWMPMVPAMRMLVLAGLARSMAATAGIIFYAVGKPEIDTKLQIIRLLVMIILIYPFIVKWGIMGASIAVFLSIFTSSFIFCFETIKITKCGEKIFAKQIIFPFINALIAAMGVFVLKAQMGTGVWECVVFAGAGVLAYGFLSYLADRFFNYKIPMVFKKEILGADKA